MGLVELHQNSSRSLVLHGTVADALGGEDVLALFSDINALQREYDALPYPDMMRDFTFVRKSYIANGYLFHSDMAPVARNEVFVFGSNLKGRHGKGAALAAVKDFGAIYGTGKGFAGRSYALPTRDANPLGVKEANVQSLTFDQVKESVSDFIEFANMNLAMRFYVTRVGCELAGFSDDEIGQLFVGAPTNCSLPVQWINHFNKV